MGAGRAATLTFAGSHLVHMQVDQSVLNSLAENSGVIHADGGQVLMTAGAKDTLLASVVNNTGVIEANTVENRGGSIALMGGATAGNVVVKGTLDVSSATAEGGEIVVTGDSVTVGDGARVEAKGASGGGSIAIGGGWEGGGNIPEATTVYVSHTATLDASATSRGNGGEIVVRSEVAKLNSTAVVAGTLLATGGVNGGDGGRIETSGHWLDVDGITANASAQKGNGGEWLLDPYNVTIGSTTSGNSYTPPNFSPTSADSTIQASTIATALAGGSSVTITTGSSGSSLGDITVNSAITKASGNADVTLTLQAADSIIVNQAISNTGGTGKLNVNLLADNDNGTHDGVGVILLNNSISTGGGYIQFGNGATMTISGASTLVGGDVYVGGSSAINLTTGGGNITVNGQTLIANTNGLTINTTGSSNGNLSFGSSIDSADSYSFVSSSGISWTSALSAAASGTGANVGDTFLATPSTRLQNSEASAAAGYQSSWLGGARGGNGNLGGSAIWYWVSGPLGLANGGTGTAFFTQNGSTTTNGSGGTAINGAFSNWNPGEPNNGSGGTNLSSSGRGEWVMQFTGSQGQWNDLNPTNTSQILGYVEETNLAASPLTINTGTGTLSIAGAVGGAKALASLTVNAASIAVGGTALMTNGAQTYNNALTINSSGDFQLSGSSLSITNPNQALSLTAAGNVTINSPSSVAGPISVSGGNVVLNANLTSTASGGAISIAATGDMAQAAGVTVSTNAGAVVYDANTAGAGGAINIGSAGSITTSGGAITLGGGVNPTVGYAQGDTANLVGVDLNSSSLLSAGGAISIRGEGPVNSSASDGVQIAGINSGVMIDSGTGTISIVGVTPAGGGGGTYKAGVRLNNSFLSTITSANTTANAISITGIATGATGATLDGVVVETASTISATGVGGGITIDGTGPSSTTGDGLRLGGSNVLANGGAINLTGQSGLTGITFTGTPTIGFKAASTVTASSSPITLSADSLTLTGTLQSTGALTIQPISASFSSALTYPLPGPVLGTPLPP